MTSSLGSQLTQAISLATSTQPQISNEQRHEAYVFLQSLKLNLLECWQPCWDLFFEKQDGQTGGGWRWGAQERMFALQVVGDALPLLPPATILYIQQTLWTYFSSEFSSSGSSENGVTYLKNALAHLSTLLFLSLYPTQSPTFFSSLLSLLPTSGPSFLPILLRILHEISTEVSDINLRMNKSSQRMTMDGTLRDAVRDTGDAGRIMNVLWEVVAAEGDQKEEGEEMKVLAMKCLADYVSWVDINLSITPTTIPLLIHCLSNGSGELKKATLDMVSETVSKGMPSTDKSSLIQVLQIPQIISSSLSSLSLPSSSSSTSTPISDFALLEKLTKLLAATGAELVKILEESSTPAETLSLTHSLLTPLHPLTLLLLPLPLNPSSAPQSPLLATLLTPYLISLLALWKKEKKKRLKRLNQIANGGATTLGVTEFDSEEEREREREKEVFVEGLLRKSVERVGYPEGWEWEAPVVIGESGEEEEEVVWAEMRKNSTVIIEALAFLSPELYSSTIQSLVTTVLDQYETDSNSVGWEKVELAVWCLWGFGQALSTPGPSAFVTVPPSEIALAKKDSNYRIPYSSYPLSVLGGLLLRSCRARLCEHPHPAVSLGMFEAVVRYWEFFRLVPECLEEVLKGFLGNCGLHREDEQVRARIYYLFSRFLIQAKQTFTAQLTPEVVANILTTIEDLLSINAEFPDDDPTTLAQLTKVASQSSFFDSQLNLFEACGSLLSLLSPHPDVQVSLLRSLLSPLLSSLQTITSQIQLPVTDENATTEVLRSILQVRHLIMALGNVSKGFPDLGARTPVAKGGWVEVFKEVTGEVLGVAKKLSGFEIVRNAARFFFNRIVVTTGTEILSLIPMLIDCLLGDVTSAELADLLSFLGLLVAKYKLEFLPILDTLLLPVFRQVFQFLEQPIAGTDDMIQHSNLRRAYFNFILSITAANLQEVLYSEKNKPELPSILQSIPHYISHDALAPDQRFGFSVLNKFLSLWVTPYRPSAAPPTPATTPTNGSAPINNLGTSPVPGFEQFLYSNVVGLCFEVPLKSNFDYGDAQSYQVIGEISNLLKGLLQKRGQEFVQFMTTNLLPSIQCPPQAAEVFMANLQEAPDGKQFKKFASEWLRTSRGPPQ